MKIHEASGVDLLQLAGKDMLSYACSVTAVVVPNMYNMVFTAKGAVSSKSSREPVSLEDTKLIKGSQ